MIFSVGWVTGLTVKSAVAAESWEVLPVGATGNTPAHNGCVLLTQYGHL